MTSRQGARTLAFTGFHGSGQDDAPVPVQFFTEVMPDITDIDELRVCLAVFQLLDEAGGFESPLAEVQILQHQPLRDAVRIEGIPSGSRRDVILHALERLAMRGVLLRVETRQSGRGGRWYFLHTSVTRALVDAITRGDLPAPRAMWEGDDAPAVTVDPPTAFLLYEQNIGPLTPMVAEHISRATRDYPVEWIEEAIGEAVAYNRRSWKYIERILESWSTNGRVDQT